MLRELPSLAPLARAISLRAALMPHAAFATANRRFSQTPLATGTVSKQALHLFAVIPTCLNFKSKTFHGATKCDATPSRKPAPTRASNQSFPHNILHNFPTPAPAFLPFSSRDQKLVVVPPSLTSPERMRRRWLVLGYLQNTLFVPCKGSAGIWRAAYLCT